MSYLCTRWGIGETRYFVALLAALTLAFGCSSGKDTAPEVVETSSQNLISDEVHNGGTDGFYFLPPVAERTPRFHGEFQPRLDPEVRIDRVNASGVTLSTVATLDADGASTYERVRRHPQREFYIARWHSGRYSLNATYNYRLRVLVEGRELGFADIDVVNTSNEADKVNKSKYVPLKKGEVLPIKFRIEREVVDQDDDGVVDWDDNCPSVPNPPQVVRDVPYPTRHTPSGCDHERDDCDPQEIDCFSRFTLKQKDTDKDGVGDACECLNVSCTAPDTCHAPGRCEATTGACVNAPTLPDSDRDGACDATDGCPNDGRKKAPGVCGCGVSDKDGDRDGVADCNDGCPSDPRKAAPLVCGCGTPDQDTDRDGTLDCNDGCPGDGSKTGAGSCGCGVADTDTDRDGTADCADTCATDPLKTTPGLCGCGVRDTDTDGDVVPDCKDGCELDGAKTEPGACGCGILDTDTDGDAAADCHDECPFDATKTTVGSCGCNVADTDTDGDGTADCAEECPADALKLAPGICGCGASDTDADNDGTADCRDECPTDATKTAAGACGCGTPDTDADGDAAPDCSDGCVSDAHKTAPGICGCGTADDDTDHDGTADCQDECASDAAKTSVGICGCGSPDVDSDHDGFLDCRDACPGDAAKGDGAGTCGCGTPDSDTDGDGTLDCRDECTLDPHKTSPGACGCGVPDENRDGDAYPDCVDHCPDDTNKVSAGVCGCGFSDLDADGDGTADCLDGCAGDPAKIEPGVCGCGSVDEDTDGDGMLDCDDVCALDPEKTDPGQCGCDTADDDADGDGAADCVDACPADAHKVDPGACGCGKKETDADEDGLMDCGHDPCLNDPTNDADGDGVCETAQCPQQPPTCPDKKCAAQKKCTPADNCAEAPNADQADSDGDAAGDACDACPNDEANDADGDTVCGDFDNCNGAANTDQANSDGDQSGDACDSCPNDAGNDADGDGACGDVDSCPNDPSGDQADADGDGSGDACDVCPNDANNDVDGDGVCGDVDDCPDLANADQTDTDGDGQGDVCDACPVDVDGDGQTACDGDCDDDDGSVYSGAVEICDGVDNDCDGALVPSEADADGDGFAACEGDCNDAMSGVHPGAAEWCRSGDLDCDGSEPSCDHGTTCAEDICLSSAALPSGITLGASGGTGSSGGVLQVGQFLELVATFNVINSPLVNTQGYYAWATSNPSVATVSTTGTVSALAPGTVTVTASLDGFSASIGLTVVGGVPARSGCGGRGFGDPHLVTHDGLIYDVQAAGEFLLAANDDIQVQARTEDVAGELTAITAIATVVDGRKVSFENGDPLLRIDGAPLEIPAGGVFFPDGSRIDTTGPNEVQVSYATGEAVVISTNPDTTGRPLTVQVCRGGDGGGGGGGSGGGGGGGGGGAWTGLFGDADGSAANDLLVPGGGSFYASVAWDIWPVFVGAWRIPEIQSFFFYGSGTSWASYNSAAFPSGPTSARSLDPSTYAWAQGICSAAGIVNPYLLSSCILDVGATGDTSYAAIAAGVTGALQALDNDGDVTSDEQDNCPTVANPDQEDTNGDDVGDACGCLNVTCHPTDKCHGDSVCDPLTSVCNDATFVDGTACDPCGSDCSGTCQGGVCTELACDVVCQAGSADCDQDGQTCETNLLDDPESCGACDRDCAAGANLATATCTGGACAISCQNGYGDCNAELGDGCEALLGTNTNCGSCGHVCAPGPNAVGSTCSFGTCTQQCAAGRANCDGNPSNGCEVGLTSDPNHCGACGVVCSRCIASMCVPPDLMFGGTSTDSALTVARTPDGGVVFGGGGVLPGGSGTDGYITKLTSSGAIAWTRLIGGTGGSEAVNDVVVDAAGNIYAVGTTNVNIAQAPRGTDGFVAKYNAAGTRLWVRQLDSGQPIDIATESLIAVALDPWGSTLIAGGTYRVDLGWVVRLDTTTGAAYFEGGSLFGAGSGTATSVQDVAFGPDGTYYAVGNTNGNLDSAGHPGGAEMFVRKMDGSGTRMWTRIIGSATTEQAGGIQVSPSGDVYVTGSTAGTLNGQASFGSYDGFVARYASNGTQQWLVNYGGSGTDMARDLVISGSLIYVVGDHTGPVPGYGSYGAADPFVVYFTNDGAWDVIDSWGTTTTDTGQAITTSNNLIVTVGNTPGPFGGQDGYVRFDVP